MAEPRVRMSGDGDSDSDHSDGRTDWDGSDGPVETGRDGMGTSTFAPFINPPPCLAGLTEAKRTSILQSSWGLEEGPGFGERAT